MKTNVAAVAALLFTSMLRASSADVRGDGSDYDPKAYHLSADYDSRALPAFSRDSNEVEETLRQVCALTADVKKERFADIGSGDGSIAFRLASHFAHATFVEQNPVLAAKLLELRDRVGADNVTVVEADAQVHNLRGYDFVTLIHLLYYIKEPAAYVARVMEDNPDATMAIVLNRPMSEQLFSEEELAARYALTTSDSKEEEVSLRDMFVPFDAEGVVSQVEADERWAVERKSFTMTLYAATEEEMFTRVYRAFSYLHPRYKYRDNRLGRGYNPVAEPLFREKVAKHIRYNEEEGRYEFDLDRLLFVVKSRPETDYENPANWIHETWDILPPRR